MLTRSGAGKPFPWSWIDAIQYYGLKLTYDKEETIMMIDHAILGLLSWKPLTGYDVKRVMQDSPFLYWSGKPDLQGACEAARKRICDK